MRLKSALILAAGVAFGAAAAAHSTPAHALSPVAMATVRKIDTGLVEKVHRRRYRGYTYYYPRPYYRYRPYRYYESRPYVYAPYYPRFYYAPPYGSYYSGGPSYYGYGGYYGYYGPRFGLRVGP